ncbi:uncharacterized protein DMAD_04469, partial [Drosophila madeirensis]
LGAERTTIV